MNRTSQPKCPQSQPTNQPTNQPTKSGPTETENQERAERDQSPFRRGQGAERAHPDQVRGRGHEPRAAAVRAARGQVRGGVRPAAGARRLHRRRPPDHRRLRRPARQVRPLAPQDGAGPQLPAGLLPQVGGHQFHAAHCH